MKSKLLFVPFLFISYLICTTNVFAYTATLEGLTGNFSESDGVYTINRVGGNNFVISQTSAVAFSYEGKVKILDGDRMSFVFGAEGNADYPWYGVEFCVLSATEVTVKAFHEHAAGELFGGVRATGLDTSQPIPFKVEVSGAGVLTVSVNNKELRSHTIRDFNAVPGRLGLLTYNSKAAVSDVVIEIFEVTIPTLTALSSNVEFTPAFSPSRFSYELFVPYDTEQVILTPTTSAENSITVNNKASESGVPVAISLKVGPNKINIKVRNNETGVSTITTVTMNRKTAYLEKYRPQFHYTPEAHWVNDPNGMVYFEGEYHLFYQYHPYSKQWGPMHWGHAISSDMVHWEEYPIALYPDEFGTMYSGSCVVDVNNTSGFFNDAPGQTGIVAIYTSAGLRQQQSIAYSLDKGRTWIKYNNGEPVIKTADDPTGDEGFRDPKVFWHEESNQWMMAIAGGPLRFYSSHNLIDWTYESGYMHDQTIEGKLVRNIHSECPDFFQLPVQGGSGSKWVLLSSGKNYIIGDFKKVNGKWHFLPDSGNRIDMNFGCDNYAAQTYSDTPDGRRIMVNWMTEFAYTGDLANITDPYNGAFTMAYELNLKNTTDGIRIYQTPIEEYKSLRKTPYVFENVTVTATSENILKDIRSNQFEIVAEFTPAAGTRQVGFNLRKGNGQKTSVYYSISSQEVGLNRITSGASPNSHFPKTFRQSNVKLENGKIKMHIFVDWSSIEVFVNDGKAVCTALIFPDGESKEMDLFVQGGSAECNVTVYPLKRIWGEDADDTSIFEIKQDSEVDLGVKMYTNEKGLNIEQEDERENIKLDIFSIDGNLIYTDLSKKKHSIISLNPGLYVVKIADGKKSIAKKMIIK